MAYIPPKYIASVSVMKGPPRTYHVSWQGLIIADCNTKSNAHTIAKNLNRMLRRFLTDTNPVYVTTFEQAFGDWCAVASDPSQGFQPTLSESP